MFPVRLRRGGGALSLAHRGAHRERRALARTWRVVIADVQARKELDRKAALELLQPIE